MTEPYKTLDAETDDFTNEDGVPELLTDEALDLGEHMLCAMSGATRFG